MVNKLNRERTSVDFVNPDTILNQLELLSVLYAMLVLLLFFFLLLCPSLISHPGSIAPKALSYTQFDNWEELIGMSTHCVGDCASDGWRLLSDEIDSGVGHGTIVDVSLFVRFSYFQFCFSGI